MPSQRKTSGTSRGLLRVKPVDDVCLELCDNSVIRKSAIDFFHVEARNPAPAAAKLSQQFIVANRQLAGLLDAVIECQYDGNDVFIAIQSGNGVGAIPLISPQSARYDFGLVVHPRFEWAGIGPMLGEMGWRIAPSPLKLPLLRRSERKVPLWVLSSMILIRLASLLKALTREFEMVHEILNSPRGQVEWEQYARTSLPTANFLSLPCTFPDLREDRLIKGAIRHTLELQIQSLQSQRHHGLFIHKLIEFAQGLVQRVRDVPVHIPTSLNLQSWLHRPMRNDRFLVS